MKNNDMYQYNFRTNRAFENATWILTNKKTGNIIECDKRKMSSMVVDGYLSYLNREYGDKLNRRDIGVRLLHSNGCDISKVKERMVQAVGYEEILPEYSVECYGWSYQCNKCNCPSDEINVKEKKGPNQIFCRHCLKFVKPR